MGETLNLEPMMGYVCRSSKSMRGTVYRERMMQDMEFIGLSMSGPGLGFEEIDCTTPATR